MNRLANYVLNCLSWSPSHQSIVHSLWSHKKHNNKRLLHLFLLHLALCLFAILRLDRLARRILLVLNQIRKINQSVHIAELLDTPWINVTTYMVIHQVIDSMDRNLIPPLLLILDPTPILERLHLYLVQAF